MPVRVVVTRPERETRLWGEALERRGLHVLQLPLISIQPVADTAALQEGWRSASDYTAWMFVSGSAVDHFFAQGPALRAAQRAFSPTLRMWAPGPGTAAALMRQGVDRVRIDAALAASAQFDSEALWPVVAVQVGQGSRVLVVRGTDRPLVDGGEVIADSAAPSADSAGFGREWLAQRLVQAGAVVDFVVAYRRSAPVYDLQAQHAARIASRDGSIWLFTSARAVANLALSLPQQTWSGARALVTHARIGHAAREAGFGVVWESRPSLADVVASIESHA